MTAPYKPKRQYKIAFEDPELEGLEVFARRVSVDELLALTDFADKAEQLGGEMTLADMPAAKEAITELCDAFGSVLVSWNLVGDDDNPVPATAEGLRGEGVAWVLKVVSGFIAGVAEASRPLPEPSPNGGHPAAEESALQLGSLSASLPSSPGPG